MKPKRKYRCRCKRCQQFRKKYPFEYLEIYGLRDHLALHILPRLKAFKANTFSNPGFIDEETGDVKPEGMKLWKAKLDEMIQAFELIAKEETTKETMPIVTKGLNTFAEYFLHLWI